MALTRRDFTHALAAGVGGLGLAGCATTPPANATLDQLARAKGLRFGSTLGNLGRRSRFHDLPYRELTGRECSVLVAENETKWQQLRPDPTRPYNFAPAEEMFTWAEGRGMALRGHTLLWLEPKWLPAWVNALNYGAGDGEAARRVLEEHIRTTCGHFGNRIESWDVVNEAVSPETGELHRNVFSTPFGGDQKGGVEQIDLAFRLAREHAPGAQLVYNDYMGWGATSARHRAGVLRLLAELKRRGTPVQALGLQGHIAWAKPGTPQDNPAECAVTWRRFLDDVQALDLELLITEFDVNDRGMPADIVQRDAACAALARDWLDVTLASPRLHRFLCWGLVDQHSWLQGFEPREDKLPKRALPYDDQLQPKPLRQAIADALRTMPAR
ncbi:endo-1,4-beta-xylanase [Roseateles cellulosilyticus]|uniref:Beta-xylanase n=1 Tax=Pelomonas cellulosilytica TaxID=2906762 RepID=A0ABS8XJP2_9BURK|nr:endo-1,4-beta-xylanase [Pelomonas sp. P8]MCE4553067.1 endo-1,4-beta-xylanase [Pelomonas sp. P8]